MKMNKQNQRRTRAVKCPACEKVKKTRAATFFHCCGCAWKIKDNLIQDSIELSNEIEPEPEPEPEEPYYTSKDTEIVTGDKDGIEYIDYDEEDGSINLSLTEQIKRFIGYDNNGDENE